jgi:hypothetical protein
MSEPTVRELIVAAQTTSSNSWPGRELAARVEAVLALECPFEAPMLERSGWVACMNAVKRTLDGR